MKLKSSFLFLTREWPDTAVQIIPCSKSTHFNEIAQIMTVEVIKSQKETVFNQLTESHPRLQYYGLSGTFSTFKRKLFHCSLVLLGLC